MLLKNLEYTFRDEYLDEMMLIKKKQPKENGENCQTPSSKYCAVFVETVRFSSCQSCIKLNAGTRKTFYKNLLQPSNI